MLLKYFDVLRNVPAFSLKRNTYGILNLALQDVFELQTIPFLALS